MDHDHAHEHLRRDRVLWLPGPDAGPSRLRRRRRRGAGIPGSFTFRSDKTLLEEASGWAKGDHATDGKGIDHFFDVYGEELIGILFTQTYPSGGIRLREDFRRLTYEALAD